MNYPIKLTKNTLGNDVLDAVEATDYVRADALSEAIEVAIAELESVERKIGVPSKALPLLRAAQEQL